MDRRSALMQAAPRLRLFRGGGLEAARTRREPATESVPGERDGRPLRLRAVLAGCLALSALSLLLPSAPTYDPWAWIVWGREITELDLMTEGGPSWKPLPVLFTGPFALLGDELAPYLWLWIGRAGGLLALAMSYRLARRMVPGVAGVAAGVVAVLALLTTWHFVRDAGLGNADALFAGLALWAFERHLDGRTDHALYVGVAAALLRPEAWPFLGLYGIWLWWREPRLRLRLAAFAVVLPLLWLGPELWGSDDAFRAASRASDPNPGSPAFADRPGLKVAGKWFTRFPGPAAGALVAFAIAGFYAVRRPRPRLRSLQPTQSRIGATLALFAGGLAWLVLVAVMTEFGFAGNQRYLIVTTAVACVLAGIAAGRLIQGVATLARGGRRGRPRPRAVVAGAAVMVAAAVVVPLVLESDRVTESVEQLGYDADQWADLRELVDDVGREDVLACGGVFAGPYQTQMLAYELNVHGSDIGPDWHLSPAPPTPPPGIAFRTRTRSGGPLVVRPSDARFQELTSYGKWRLETVPPVASAVGAGRCPSAGPGAPTTSTTLEGLSAFGGGPGAVSRASAAP